LPPSLRPGWCHALGRFRIAYPDIDVRVTASDDIVDFARDDIDLAIRYGGGHWPGLEVVALMTEDVFPVCSPALLDGPHPLRHPEDLRHHTLLHDDMRETWRMWRRVSKASTRIVGPAIICQPWSLMLRWTAKGLPWHEAPWPVMTWTAVVWSGRLNWHCRRNMPTIWSIRPVP
jgi:DNA-binding transcriptional LysR family regulator